MFKWKMFNRCRETIENVIKRKKERCYFLNLPQKGSRKLMNLRDERRILKGNWENSSLSAPNINIKITGSLRTSVSNATIRRALRANTINGRLKRKKSYIS